MPYRILTFPETDQPTFVHFWSRQYDDSNDELYTENIDLRPLTPHAVRELFRWKTGGKLSQRKRQSVEQHFVARLHELQDFQGEFDAASFFERFQGNTRPIWRIFFLHIHQPDRFPIFDQHVFRAMRYIQAGTVAELPGDPVQIYMQDYRHFHEGFGVHQGRAVDKALWAFGKFLKLHYQFDEA